MPELESYVPSTTQEGAYWRVSLAVVQGRIHIRCTCPAGRHNQHRPLPCKHARTVLGRAAGQTRAYPAPEHDRNGRPEFPPNVSAMVD